MHESLGVPVLNVQDPRFFCALMCCSRVVGSLSAIQADRDLYLLHPAVQIVLSMLLSTR